MVAPVGEKRIVTVLVADIAGSTAIGEQVGPERSKFLFDEVIRLMREQVERYDGTVAQLTGDGLLALFGAPVAHEDDSERAVRAALEIQDALSKYGRDVEAAFGVKLAARIGVNTGPVVVSEEASDGGVRWNALGDTVNVAARLERAAPEGGVVVGPTTARQIEGSFELEELGERDLKGKAAPVAAFSVQALREVEPARPALPLVGREFELAVLERALDGLGEGRGTIVSVIGEPGIGKTRLLAEACERYGDRVAFVEGRGVSYAQNLPYWPVRDLLREWLGVGISTPEARIRLELKARLGALFPDVAAVYPFFAALVGLVLEPDAAARLRELNHEATQHATFEVFAELVCRLAAERPLALVLEDLHWADEATLDLVEELLAVTEEAAVGIFLLYRTEREHGSWRLGERARQRYPHRYREIELEPLPADASRALAASAAGGALPDSVAELLAERAGGNPFFLEEALRDLVERGALERDDGSWRLVVGVDELAVPAIVQGALQARLDRLEGNAREVLSVAAVVGRRFGLELLERIVPREELILALSALQRLDLVVELRRRPTAEYRFRHGLVQEVAYASLGEGRRRALHARVGAALEELHRESPEEVYGVLARHFTEADEPEKAVDYLLKAGDAARALYAEQEALDHYRRASEFLVRLGDDRRARDTLFKIALAHHLAFDFEEAEAAYDEAFCCKAEEPPGPEATERIETAAMWATDLAPGESYSMHGQFFTEQLFRGLLALDADLNVVPATADNFRVSADGLTYLFRLRDGARWSDGVPLTAGDFAFAWERMGAEQSPTAFVLEDVEEAVALDDRTLQIRLRTPRNYFPYVLASAWSLPWPRHACQALGPAWREPGNLVGNGPFRLAEFDVEHALLVANPHWPGPRSNVREVLVVFAASPVEEWLSGRYDVLELWNEDVGEAAETLVQLEPTLNVAYVGFRADAGLFSNRLVRKAFSHAVDREALVAGSPMRAATIGGLIPPAMPGHSHGAASRYDLETARRLLAEAGYPEGRALPAVTLAVAASVWDAMAREVAEQWRALGANVEVVVKDEALGPLVVEGHDAWVAGWTADYPDPDGMFRGFFRFGWPFYRDGDVEDMLAEARSLADKEARIERYQELERRWIGDQAAVVPLGYSRRALLRRPWVDEVAADPLSPPRLESISVRRS